MTKDVKGQPCQGTKNSSSDEELCTASMWTLILKLQPLLQALIRTVVWKWSGRILLGDTSDFCVQEAC